MPRNLILVCVLLFVVSASASADGKYWPEEAYAAEPDIPLQRAIVVYRDGMETLVVESAFESPSPNVGWVLPLPAAPTRLDVADAGMLKSLAMCLQPEITHDLHDAWTVPLMILAGLLPLLIVATFVRNVWRRLLYYVFILAVAGFFLVTSAHLGMRHSMGGGITVLAEQRVGSYNVSVLRARTAQDLSQWLTDNALRALDEDSAKLVADYISRDWCFLVAHLRREAGGAATPHPISATFPVKVPVYPMKLTSLAGSTTRVELFVIAEEMAKAEDFRLVLADRYCLSDIEDKPVAPHYRGRSCDQDIGSPDVGALMWDDCAVTKLTADLTPEQMDRDVELTLTELTPHRDHLYSARGRRELTWAILLWGAIPLLLVASVVFHQGRRARPWELKLLGALLLALFLCAGYAWTSVEVIEVRVGRMGASWWGNLRTYELRLVATQMAADGVLHAGMTEAELTDFAGLAVEKDYWHGRIENPLTGEPMRFERSPGNISTRKVADKTYLCLYDAIACEWRVELPEPKTERQGHP